MLCTCLAKREIDGLLDRLAAELRPRRPQGLLVDVNQVLTHPLSIYAEVSGISKWVPPVDAKLNADQRYPLRSLLHPQQHISVTDQNTRGLVPGRRGKSPDMTERVLVWGLGPITGCAGLVPGEDLVALARPRTFPTVLEATTASELP